MIFKGFQTAEIMKILSWFKFNDFKTFYEVRSFLQHNSSSHMHHNIVNHVGKYDSLICTTFLKAIENHKEPQEVQTNKYIDTVKNLYINDFNEDEVRHFY